MQVGIVGFPGSGKSTVFKALSPGGGGDRGGVTYGNIKVPDARVDRLAKIFKPRKTTFAEITFMDVQGGGGKVGGAFPPTVIQAMRNADVLAHVIRGFESPFHEEPPSPERDRQAFADELILLDLGVLEKMQERWRKTNKKGPEMDTLDRAVDALNDGVPLRDLNLDENARAVFQGVQLLSIRPLITVYNLSEESWATSPLREAPGENAIAICGSIEAEIAGMPPEEQAEFLDGLGLGEPARNAFIRTAYHMLDLISFLTAGEDECRAWNIRRGMSARKAAGRIHSDLERGFIRAEVYRVEDLEHYGNEAALRSAGKIRLEGKDYVVQDGDVMNIRFNV